MNSGIRKLTSKFTRLRSKYGGRCGYCGIEVPDDQFALDHVIPRAAGGDSSESNLMFCCCSCNMSKNARDVGEFRDFLRLKNSSLRGIIQPRQYRKLLEAGVDLSAFVASDFRFFFEKQAEL